MKKKKTGPNSWGRTSYDNLKRQLQYDKQIDVNNGKKKRTFIRAWIIEHLTGAKLLTDINK